MLSLKYVSVIYILQQTETHLVKSEGIFKNVFAYILVVFSKVFNSEAADICVNS